MGNRIIAWTFLAALAACGDDGTDAPSLPEIPDTSGAQSPPLPTSFAIGLANFDAVGHVAWMMWQDGSPNWAASFVASLPAATTSGSANWSGVFEATPGTDYWLVLADETGAVLDSVDLGIIGQGQTRVAYYRVVGARLLALQIP